jgi:glycosyltransferase involved in cell wall biosynthesis
VKDKPLVSVIIIFLNAEKFIQEAIESVIYQTYANLELLLVDDGSTDKSTNIALEFLNRYPNKVRYLEHPNHENRGKGASRNIGISNARGVYVAFLDADDIWLPQKLEYQVEILDNYPEAGMLYGNTLYWYSWSEELSGNYRDFMPDLGLQADRLVEPPQLLPLFLTGKAAVPCTCSLLVRRSVAQQVGGFDETFIGIANIYEDQAFYAKICLNTPVYISDTCWDWYRQHSSASIAIAKRTNQETVARLFFLYWLSDYIERQSVKDSDVRRAINRELWRLHYPDWLPKNERLQHLIRWFKKWFLKLDELINLASVRRILWKQS